MGHTWLTYPAFEDTYRFLENSWYALLESYQQRLNSNSLATVERMSQHADNPALPMVISLQVACVNNAILLDNLTSQMAIEETEIRRSNRNIPIDYHYANAELHFRMLGDSEDDQADRNDSDKRDAIPTASQGHSPQLT
jgi:hypothetical protein